VTHSGPVAQRLEQQTHNLLVVGSSPTGPTIFNDLPIALCHLVTQLVATGCPPS
jgi:hypothetical protein